MTPDLRRRQGTIKSIKTRRLGDYLREDVGAGQFMLPVDDAGDFKDGQTVRLGGDETDYTISSATCRGERLSITPALTKAAERGTSVRVWNTKTGRPWGVRQARVAATDGEEDETLSATLSSSVGAQLDDGDDLSIEADLFEDGTGLIVWDTPGADHKRKVPGEDDNFIDLKYRCKGTPNADPSPKYVVPVDGFSLQDLVLTAQSGGVPIEIHVAGEVITTLSAGFDVHQIDLSVKTGDEIFIKTTGGSDVVNPAVLITLERD